MEELKTFSLSLLNQMEEKVLSSRLTCRETWEWIKTSIGITSGYLAKLRAYITAHPFKKRSEEVFFFKKVKPLFMSRILFFSELWNIESSKPLGRQDNLLANYLWTELNKIEEFFITHTFLYDYYKDQQDYMDFKLFVRYPCDRFHFSNIPLKVLPVTFYGDPEFSTGYDYLFAQFRAYETLKQHLLNEYEKVWLYPDAAGEPNDHSGNFDEAVRLFEKIASPFLNGTEKVLRPHDISLFIGNRRLYPPGKPTEFVIHPLFKPTDHLPSGIRDTIIYLNNAWENEIADYDYTTDQKNSSKIA